MNFNPYALCVDVLLIAVFAWTVYRAWKRGLVDAAAGLLSVIGAVVVSRMFGFVLEGVLRRKLFDPLIGETVASVIQKALDTVHETAGSASDAITAAVTQALDGIRTYTDMLGIPLNIDPDRLSGISPNSISGEAANALAADIAAPIAETLASWSAYLLLFLIAYAVLRFVFRIIDLVMRLPLLHEANSLLGCVCGILLGTAYAFLAARLAAVVLGILVTRGTLPPEVLSGTIFGLLSGNKPL